MLFECPFAYLLYIPHKHPKRHRQHQTSPSTSMNAFNPLSSSPFLVFPPHLTPTLPSPPHSSLFVPTPLPPPCLSVTTILIYIHTYYTYLLYTHKRPYTHLCSTSLHIIPLYVYSHVHSHKNPPIPSPLFSWRLRNQFKSGQVRSIQFDSTHFFNSSQINPFQPNSIQPHPPTQFNSLQSPQPPSTPQSPQSFQSSNQLSTPIDSSAQ